MSLIDLSQLVVGEGNEFLGQVLASQFIRVKISRFGTIGFLEVRISAVPPNPTHHKLPPTKGDPQKGHAGGHSHPESKSEGCQV